MRNVSGEGVVVEREVSPPAVVGGLRAASNYTLELVLVFVGGGEGGPVSITATTLEGGKSIMHQAYVTVCSHTIPCCSAVPEDAPTIVMTFALGPTSVRVTWTPPTSPNGMITTYTLYYSTPSSSANLTLEGRMESHDLTDLRPHTNYTILVSASTLTGEGPSGPEGGVVVATEQGGMCSCMCELCGWYVEVVLPTRGLWFRLV